MPVPAHTALSTAETVPLGTPDFDPVDLDTLCERIGWAVAVFFSRLPALKLDSRVKRQPDERFLRFP